MGTCRAFGRSRALTIRSGRLATESGLRSRAARARASGMDLALIGGMTRINAPSSLVRTMDCPLSMRWRWLCSSLVVASLLVATGALAGVSTFGEYDPVEYLGSHHGITVDREGNLYVAEGTPKRVRKFDEAGNFLGQLGMPGSDDGVSYYPTNVAVDSSGNIYVTESSHPFQSPAGGRLQKFDREGNVLWAVPIPFQTFAVTLDPTGRLYTVASGTSDNVTQYDRRDGTVLNQWSCSDGYRGANGLATDPAGNLYLGMGLKVDFVDPLGHALGSLPVAASYVATDPSGSIYALSMYGLLTKFS